VARQLPIYRRKQLSETERHSIQEIDIVTANILLEALGQLLIRHKAVVGVMSVAIATGLWAAPTASVPDQSLPIVPSTAISTVNPANSGTIDGQPSTASTGTLDDALRFGRQSQAALTPLVDYTAVFTKTELIGGELLTQTMDFKCRRKPFSVYLRNQRRGGKGREVIYVAGANDNNLLVHESGLKSVIGTLQLKPNCPKVLEANRHPVTDVGLDRLVEMAMAMWETDQREADPAHVDVQFFNDVNVGEVICDEVQVTHRKSNPRISYQIGRLFVEKQTRIPIQAEVYGWPHHTGDEPPLLEKYTYTQIQTNVGLTEHDFDPQNPDYHFASR
jgi:hypothetical protein